MEIRRFFYNFQMHTPLLLLAVILLLGVQAKPEGFYHAESAFHRSSSSYRNNELQRQNQDEGFYSEDGDLERQTKPKVNSYAQHSEYVNPKLRTGEYNSNHGIDSGFDGQYAAGSQYSQGSAYKGGSRTSSYGVAANLEELSQRLQTDLSRQLHNAIAEEYTQSSAYSRSSSSAQQDVRRFEDELRANLTRKLQEALYEQYGQQAVRGPYSYSISRGGATSNTANYNVQDLEDLKRQLENNLVNQLQQEVRTRYEASESRSSYSSSNHDASAGYRPVALSADSQVAGVKTAHRPVTGYRYTEQPSYSSSYTPRYSDQTGSYSETANVGYSSSVTYRLTDLAIDVQNELSRVVDEILTEEQRKNTDLIQRGVRPNYDETFQYLRQTLIRNISDRIDEKINRYYGSQVQRGDQYYSLTPSGTSKSQPNYSREDLENLKQQVEDNLVEKLSYGIRQQESRYDEERRYVQTQQTGYRNSQSSSSSASFSSAGQHGVVQPVVPLSSHTSTGQYDYRNSHRQTGYEVNPDSEVELTNIQQQLQNDLSRQLQYAIRDQTKEYSSYASSGSVGSSSYQTALQQLQDELRRNVTEQLQRILTQHYGDQRTRGSYSYSTTAGGSLRSSANYNQEQVDDITRRLQENLMRQLQEGLRQSWSSQYSYSSSSSYNRPAYGVKSAGYGTKGHAQSYTQYGEDCDENGYSGQQTYRGKREIVLRNRGNLPSRSNYYDQQGLTQQTEDGFDYYQQQQQGLTQQQEDLLDDFRNQQEDDYYSQQQQRRANLADLTQQQQQTDLQDLTQQQEDDYYDQQQQEDLRQKNQNQQTETLSLDSKPGFGIVRDQKPSEKLRHSAELDDLTQQQQTEDIYGNLQIGSRSTTEKNYFQQSNENLQQNQDFDDLTQQQQTDDTYGNLQVGSQIRQKRTTTEANYYRRTNPQIDDLTQQQQTEDIYGNLQLGSQIREKRTTTEANYYRQTNPQLQDDLTQQQQTEDIYDNLQVGSQNRGKTTEASYYRRTSTESDLTQQQSEDVYGNLAVGSQIRGTTTTAPNYYRWQHSRQFGDLTQQQQTEDIYGNAFSVSTTKKPLNLQKDDLTQQQETEDIYGNLASSRRTTRKPYSYQQLNYQVDDLTQQQQTEDIYGNLYRTTFKPYYYQVLGGNSPKIPQSDDLTQQQQTEDIYGNLEIGSKTTTEAYNQQAQDNFEWVPHGAQESIQTGRAQYNYRNQKTSSTTTTTETYNQQQQEDEEPQGVIPLSSANQQQLENDFSNLEIASQTKPKQHDDQQVQQQTDDLTQQSQNNEFGGLQFSSQRKPIRNDQEGLTQQTEDGFGTFSLGSQQNVGQSDLTQQLEDGFAEFNSRETLSHTKPQEQEQQQTVGEPIGRQDGSPSYYPPGYQGSRYTGSYRSGHQITPLSQYTVQQAAEQQSIEKSEEVEDLVQKPIEKQTAYQVQDVSQQAEVRQLPEEQHSAESIEQEAQTEEPQPQTGFWKRVGNKFSNAYTSVKDKAKEVFG